MATVGNERKKSRWAWFLAAIVALLLVLALVALLGRHRANSPEVAVPATAANVATSPAQPTQVPPAGTIAAPAAIVIAPMPPPPTPADSAPIPVDVIVMAPAQRLGQPVVGTATVAEVPFDRGFWLEKNGQRLFAVIAQAPGMKQAVNVNPGQTIRLAGIVYDSALASAIKGQMDPQALQVIERQPAFLLVDARNIAVVDAPSE